MFPHARACKSGNDSGSKRPIIFLPSYSFPHNRSSVREFRCAIHCNLKLLLEDQFERDVSSIVRVRTLHNNKLSNRSNVDVNTQNELSSRPQMTNFDANHSQLLRVIEQWSNNDAL